MTADAALAALAYDVFVSPSIPLSLTDLTPDGQARTWAPVSTTLVSGDHDAVVVEPPLSVHRAWRSETGCGRATAGSPTSS